MLSKIETSMFCAWVWKWKHFGRTDRVVCVRTPCTLECAIVTFPFLSRATVTAALNSYELRLTFVFIVHPQILYNIQTCFVFVQKNHRERCNCKELQQVCDSLYAWITPRLSLTFKTALAFSCPFIGCSSLRCAILDAAVLLFRSLL